MASRPHTLMIGVNPVLVGCALAWAETGRIDVGLASPIQLEEVDRDRATGIDELLKALDADKDGSVNQGELANFVDEPAAETLTDARGAIEFDHVWFRHPPGAVVSLASLEAADGGLSDDQRIVTIVQQLLQSRTERRHVSRGDDEAVASLAVGRPLARAHQRVVGPGERDPVDDHELQ